MLLLSLDVVHHAPRLQARLHTCSEISAPGVHVDAEQLMWTQSSERVLTDDKHLAPCR